MAFLKSSQLSLGPKTVDVKGFTQAETLKLGDRAYTEHEILLADNYSIVGDVTVSDDLIISKLSDDGNDITITGDTTTRTISGAGSIQGATLAQTPNATVTGMSGTLGSGVTIGSDVTFPKGAVIQTQTIFDQEVRTCTTQANAFTDVPGFNVSITPRATSSKILVFLHIGCYNFSSTNYGLGHTLQLRRKIGSGNFGPIAVGNKNTLWNGTAHLGQINAYQYSAPSATFLDSPATTSKCTYGIAVVDHNNNAQTFYLNQTGASTGGAEANQPYSASFASSIVVQEIAG